MARCDKPGAWDFIEIGKLYQYKEDHVILVVEILDDNSTEDFYEFLVKPIAGTFEMKESFTVSFTKNNTGAYNGMSQFYENPEYVMLPIGTPYPFIFDEEKLKGSKFV